MRVKMMIENRKDLKEGIAKFYTSNGILIIKCKRKKNGKCLHFKARGVNVCLNCNP